MKRLSIQIKRNRLVKPNRKGFSLVTVASLGAVTMMWLMAISASVLPMYQKAAQARFTTVVRSSAEASLDYAVTTLKSSIGPSGNITSQLDDGALHDVPGSVLTADDTAQGQIAAKIKVLNVSPPNSSSIYQKQNDVEPTTGFFPNQSSGVPMNGWRVVVAAAEYANQVRGIRVILEPTFNVVGQTVLGTNTPQPFFNAALMGDESVSFGGNADTDGYDSRLGPYSETNSALHRGDVVSNGNRNPPSLTTAIITTSANTNINGDVRVFSGGDSSGHTQLDVSGGGTIQDQLSVNGLSTVLDANVLGAESLPADRYLVEQSQAQMPIPPPQTPSQDAQVVAAQLSTSGNTVTVAPPGANQVVNLGTLSIAGNTTYNLQPGDYQVSSIQISGNGQLNIVPPSGGNPNTSVRFFVQGNASGSNAIQITGNGIVNTGSPSQMQIWYSGSKGTLISGNGNFTGIVYAPSSSIQVSGNGEVFGALVGKQIRSTGNGNFHYDIALGENAQNLGLTWLQNTQTEIPDARLAGLRTISWQELSISQLAALGLYDPNTGHLRQ